MYPYRSSSQEFLSGKLEVAEMWHIVAKPMKEEEGVEKSDVMAFFRVATN